MEKAVKGKDLTGGEEMEVGTVKGDGESEVRKVSDDRLRYLALWDAYAPLLTDSQREMCEKYYLYDLSLSEIAEEKGVSKQAVSDSLKTSRELLDFYEGKLHFNEQNQRYSLAVSFMMTDITRALGNFKKSHPEYAKEMDEIIEKVTVGEEIDLGETDGKEE